MAPNNYHWVSLQKSSTCEIQRQVTHGHTKKLQLIRRSDPLLTTGIPLGLTPPVSRLPSFEVKNGTLVPTAPPIYLHSVPPPTHICVPSHRPTPMRDSTLHHLLFTLLLLFSSVFSAPPRPLLHDPPSPLPAVPAEFKVGLVLDMNSPVGMMSRTSINMALSDFYAAFPNSTTRIVLLPRDSAGDVVSCAAAGTSPSFPSFTTNSPSFFRH